MDAILTLLIQMQLNRHLAPNAVSAEQLAPVIYKLANEYEIDPQLIVKIIIVESKGVATAQNKRTHDTGIMQINKSTAWLYGIKKECLLNWRCNLEAGVMILSDLQAYKNYRHCTYNTGPKWQNKITSCKKYEARLASIN